MELALAQTVRRAPTRVAWPSGDLTVECAPVAVTVRPIAFRLLARALGWLVQR